MMRKFTGMLAFFAVVLAMDAVHAESELTAQQIVDKALEHNAFGFENAVARLTLQLVSKRGHAKERKIEIRSTERENRSRSLVRFHAPADVAGVGFLVLENKDTDDDQYLYLPALGKVKRITGSQRNQKFMGTDLTYADLESRNLRRAHLTRKDDEVLSGNPTYVIEALPKDPKDSQYSKTITWVHQVSFVPLKVEFFDKKGKPVKTLTVRRLERKDGKWIAMATHIKDVQSGTQTIMQVDSIDFSVTLHDTEFTERALAGG